MTQKGISPQAMHATHAGHWAWVMLCWLLGVAAQLQQAELGHGASVALLAGVSAVLLWLGDQALSRSGASSAKWHAQTHWRSLLWGLSAALLGWGHAQWQASQRLEMQWPVALSNDVVTLVGQVDSLPAAQAWGLQITVRVHEVRLNDRRWRAGQPWASMPGICPERVAVTWASSQRPQHPEAVPVQPGQVWQWPVRLHRPDGRFNPGGFDSEQWFFQQGLRAQGKVIRVKKDSDLMPPRLLHQAQAWDATWLDRLRDGLVQRVRAHVRTSGMPPDMAGLLIGLTLGEQSAIGKRHWQIMRDTGIAHLAAISGLHITMVGWLLGVLTGICWRRSMRLMMWLPAISAQRWATVFGAGVYAALAGWGIPAQRTVLMLTLVVLLKQTGRRWPWPLVLLLAAVLVTGLDPWALSQAGFWLSFGAIGLLMLAAPAPVDADAATRPWHQKLASAGLVLWQTQWRASLGLAPLSLVFFQTVSLLSFLTNLVCVPLFTLVVTPLALLGYVWPSAWNGAGHILHWTLAPLDALAKQPAYLWQAQQVHPWAAAMALLAVAWMLAPWPWRWRVMAVPVLLFLLWPTRLSQRWPAPPPHAFQVLAADVGQGTSVLVRTASHALLYDTGPKYSENADTGDKVLLGLLRSTGVRVLDELLISHGDMDHIGGAATLLDKLPVRRLRHSLDANDALLQQAQDSAHQPQVVACQAGQHWEWDGVSFEILHPSPTAMLPQRGKRKPSDNARSCVLRVYAAGRQALITGDLEAPQEQTVLEAMADKLRSDVLLVPHHGSKTSSTEAFLAAVKPRVAVVQAGARNRYGHPHPQVMSRYRTLGIAVVQSKDCGAWWWQSHTAAEQAEGQCWRETQKRYWHEGYKGHERHDAGG
jgi:competence protein ComEC